MHTQTGAARPGAYWWIAVLALAWNLIGLAMFFIQVTLDGEQLMKLTEAQRAVHLATPGWVNLAFAFAVIGGVLGALSLLLRRRWAVPMFAISLLALLVQMVGGYAVTPAWAAYGAAGLAMPALLLVVALLQWNYARRCRARGWLR
ncbi:MAG: sugar transporter [Xanthomonadaceae bacterium]|nr:sugar transporter [Xanthomonadaceae bacterium]MCA0197720.1 sugar transporter [Pseudomonadota bacterium]